MVKAELSYNPYLLETRVRFNGQEPRINSLVEKYQQDILQNWVKKIPYIFYDEMNGYDFELEFSGTALEFDDLRNAFLNAGVSSDMVRFFHKNELDGRNSKAQKVDELLKWFETHPNRKFDYYAFLDQNNELFNSDYVCIILNGETAICELSVEYVVSMENIQNVNELDKTSLVHTPIILCIDEKTLPKMKGNLRYFFDRKDVQHNQLFFLIQPVLDVSSIERTIHDLGIEKPNLIECIDDAKIKRFLETYPVTDYIYDSIKVLREQETKIAEVLEKENAESMISNREIHMHIDVIEDDLKRLKEALELFVNRDNLDAITEMHVAKAYLLNAIQNWRNRKTKISKETEAINLAQDLDYQVQKLYQEFCQKIERIMEDKQTAIELKYKNWYEGGKNEKGFMPNVSCIKKSNYKEIPALYSALLKMKEEKYVMPKEDLFGLFFKPSNEKEQAPVLEITFDCQKWRDYAINMMEPIVSSLIQENEIIMKKYATELAELYQVQLEELIKDRTAVKETVAAQLSDDEQKLQEDNDWLVGFQDQLRAIERG